MENKIPTGDRGIPGERNDVSKSKDKREKFEHMQRYKYALEKSGTGVTLDVGCGTGYGSKLLMGHGKKKVYGIDISLNAIEYAKINYPGPLYLCVSGENLPFENDTFMTITAFEVLEHVYQPEKLVAELYRVLKPNGDLFISSPNPRHLINLFKHILLRLPYPQKIDANNIYHIKEFHYGEFVDLIRNVNFKILDICGQTLPVVPWRIEVNLAKLPLIYKCLILMGTLCPKYARTVVVHAKK